MILLAMIFGTFSSTLHAQQLSPNAPVVAASLSVAPDISGLCIGSTVLVPIHITGDGVLSLNLYIEFDHSVLAKAPGAGYANLFPGFNALYNYAYSGAFPTVSYLDISSNELIGTNFTGEKLMDLAFVYMGGSTTIHFRTSPNPTPPPLCKMFDEFGTQILPVTYTDNLVSGYPNLTVGTISGNQTICSGIVPAQLTGTPPSNGTSPTYQWQSSPDNSTFTDITGATSINFQPAALSATTYYRLMQNATGTCTGPKPTNTVTIAVNPLLPVSLTIAVTANPVCAGTVVTFSATPVNGGSSPVYHWKIDGGNIPGATSSSFINIPSDGDVITCELTSNATCASGSPALSSPIAMIVNPILPVAVAVTPSANPVCAGTAVTYTAAPINGGTTPVYQWMVNGAPVGTGTATYTFTPANSDIVKCQMTSSEACTTGNPAMSNSINMTVLPVLPVAVAVTPSANPVCGGTTVTFTAVPLNGGTTPAYQWYVNGVPSGTNSTTYSYSPANNDVVTCQLTASGPCTSGNPAMSNTVTMTVNPVVAVAVAINASANPVCTGTAVTYTASPINGGTTPTYLWKVNGVAVGTNSTTYSYTPVNSDVVTCQLTSSEPCTLGNPAISNTVTMAVLPILPVIVAVTPSANPVCDGTSVTYTAVPLNGGTTPTYAWMVNGAPAGSNSATFSYTPANGDVVTCQLTSSEPCTSGSPALSNTVTMTVFPVLPVFVSVTPSNNPVCAGVAVTFSAASINAGTTPVYQWTMNGVSVGSNSTTYSYTPANNDVVTCLLTSSEPCTSGNPAVSNAVTMTVNPILPVSVAVTPSVNPICNTTVVTFTAVPVNGGTTPAYQWNVNGSPAGANSATYSYAPANNDIITCQLTSSELCTSGNPALSNTVTMSVDPNLLVGTISANQTICSGVTPAVLSSTAPLTGTSPTYQWQSSLDNNTFGNINGATLTTYQAGALTATTYYRQMQDASGVCGGPLPTNTVTITVNPILPVAVAINASANPACNGSSVTFTASPLNGGTTPAYQWMVNGVAAGTNSAAYTYAPANNDVVTCQLTSSEACTLGNPAMSNTVTMTVLPILPVAVAVTPSANPVCNGTTVTFTAVPLNGGVTPSYLWMVNGAPAGTDNSTFSYSPVNNDVVTCQLTSSEPCTSGNPAMSNTVTMTVIPVLPVSVTVTASANPVCNGTSVTFTAAPVNGGTTPSFLWSVNGSPAGTNSNTFTYSPSNNDVVACQLTSSEPCTLGNPAVSNTVTMTVNAIVPVSVAISSSANPVCTGNPVTFTATPVNGGSTPTYQWFLNSFAAGSNSSTYTFVPTNNDVVACQMTSSELCTTGNPATSNIVTLSVIDGLLVGSISADQTICAGVVPAQLTGTAPSNGTSPTYQWQSSLDNTTFNNINGATSLNYQPGALTTTTYYKQMQNAAGTCGGPLPTNTVTISVNPLLPVAVAVTPSANPVCAGNSVSFFAATINGGTTPVYQWMVNGVAAGSNSSSYSYTPANNDVVTCQLTSSETCTVANPVMSNTVTMTVIPILPVAVAINASANPSCAGASVTFTATPLNGGTTPAYQWFVNGVAAGTNSATYSYAPANNDVVTCQLTSSEPCTSGNPALSNTVTMTVFDNLLVGTIAADQTICSGVAPAGLTSTGPLNGIAPTYQWQSSLDNNTFNNINGATLATYQPGTLTSTTYFKQLQDASGVCGGPLATNAVTITVNPVLPVAVAINSSANPSCTGAPVTFTATPVNGGTTPSYLWFVNGTSAGTNSATYTYVPVNNDVVTCVLNSSETCTLGNPATSNTITMTVFPDLLVGTISADQTICSGIIPAQLTSTGPLNGVSPTYQWQSSLDNSTFGNINGATSQNYQPGALTSTTYYKQMQDASGVCGGPLATNTVTITVNPLLPVAVAITPSANPVCAGISVTYFAATINSGSTPAYLWMVNGVPAGTNSSSFSYTPANNDVVTCQLTSSEACTVANPVMSNTVVMTVLPVLPVAVAVNASANPSCIGASVTYTATPLNGGTTPAYQWFVNGVPAGTNSTTYNYVPANGDVVTCQLTSSEPCTLGNPAMSNTINMTVFNNLLVGTIAADQTICSGIVPALLTSNGPLNGVTPSYQWQSSLDNNTFNNINGATLTTYQPGALTSTTYYKQLQDASGVCGGPLATNTVTITVNPLLPVAIAVTPSANPVCAGVAVTYFAATINGGTTPAYLWTVNGIPAGTNSSSYSYTPANGDVVTCQLTSSETCTVANPVMSNTVTMTVMPILPVAVAINPSANPSCAGIPVTFTASPINGGTTPAYQWYVNGVPAGSNNTTYSYVPADGDVITCQLTSSEPCNVGNPAMSNTVNMTVFPNLIVGSIAADQTICAGLTPALITATPPSNGTTPVYQWQSSLDNNTFADINGATTQNYQPGALTTTTYYKQLQNATGTCNGPLATNVVTITVTPQFVVGSISADQTICNGSAPALLTGVPPVGGTSPVYQWQSSLDNATFTNINGATSLNYQPGALTTTTYYQQIQNTSGSCGGPQATNVVTITVGAFPAIVPGSISADQFLCIGNVPALLTATPPSNGTSPTYQWQSSLDNSTFSNINGATTQNYQPGALSATTYYKQLQDAQSTCGGPAATNVVTITVNPTLAVGSISANQAICYGNTPALLTATAPSNGTSPTYQWQSSLDNSTFNNINGATSQNYQPGALTSTTYYRQNQNALNTCGGPLSTNVVTVTVNPLPLPTIAGPSSVCLNSAGNVYTTQSGMTGYTWTVSAGGVITAGAGTSAITVTWNTVGPQVVTVSYTNTSNCTAATPGTYNVTVNPLPVPTITGPASVCMSSTGNIYTTEAGMTGYTWTVSAGGSITAGAGTNAVTVTWNTAGAQTVSVNYINANACSAATATTYNVTVNALPVPTIAGPASVCVNSTGNIYTTESGMTGYTWTVSAGGNITAGNGTSAITVSWNTTGAQTVTVNYNNGNGCTAATATVYNVTVNALPVPTISGPASVCLNSTGNVYTTETGMTGYTWTVSAGGNITAGAGTSAITVTWSTTGAQTVTVNYNNANGCTAATATTYNVTVNALPVPTIAGPASVCVNSTGNVYTTESGMTGYTWTVSAGGSITAGAGTNAVTVTWSTAGANAVTVNYNNANGCTAATATVYNVTVNALPVPTITGPASVCLNSTGNVYNTETGMTGYTWTVSAGGTITAGAGTSAITVTWTTTGAKTVTVNYTNGNGCTAATPATYTVTVNALPVPTIAGPASVCVNSTGNVYTTQTGMTGYTWTVSAGGIITAGAGTNAITVTWNTIGANTVTVNYTNGSGCTAAAPVTYNVTVNALPVPTITGPASVCVNSTGNVYTTQTGMTGYTWTVSAGGTITAGAGTSAITVTWTTAGAKTVCVTYTNAGGCTAAAPVCYNVTVNAVPTPTIAGPALACQGSTATYTTQTGMTGYVWTVSAGGTITSGAGTSSVTVSWNATGAQNLTVTYTNVCPAATPGTYSVTVNSAPVPTIGSTNNPCVGSTNNIYYTESGMTGYVWTVSAGGTIVSGQGTSILDVTWNQIGLQTVSVNYTSASGCSAAQPTVYTVFVNSPPSAAGAITGTATVCAGTNGVVYSTTPVTGATSYSWTVPAGATIASGSGTTSITVNYGTSAVSGNVTVAATNQCGNGPSSTFAVTVNPLPAAAGTITGPASVCAGSTGVYTVAAISGATSYVWTVPAGATFVQSANSITVTFGNTPAAGIITVKGTNSCGSGNVSPNFNVTINAIPAAPVVTAVGPLLTSSIATGNQWYYEGTGLIAGATNQTYTATITGWYWSVVTVNGCSSDTSNHVYVLFVGQNELAGSNFNVYPVPNDGKFNVSIHTPTLETFTIQVYNLLGEKLYEQRDVTTSGGRYDTQIDLRPIARGVYSVVFLNSQYKVVKKMVVKK